MRTMNRKTAVLKEIKREFSNFRSCHQGGNGGGYPQALRELALSGLKQGSAPHDVSEAAGVTVESLRNWRRGAQGGSVTEPALPVELKLVESREPLPAEAPASPFIAPPEAIARISLRSGVQMTLPVSALSERLISLLTGGVT